MGQARLMPLYSYFSYEGWMIGVLVFLGSIRGYVLYHDDVVWAYLTWIYQASGEVGTLKG